MFDPNKPIQQGQQNQQMSNIDPETLQYLLQNYGDVMGLGNTTDQLEQARALRDTAAPQTSRAGGMTVMANPMSHIGRGMKQYAGLRDEKAAMGQRDKLQGQISDRIQQYGNEIVNPGVQHSPVESDTAIQLAKLFGG